MCYFTFSTRNVKLLVLFINPLKAEINPIFHVLALLGEYHNLHVRRIRVKPKLFFVVFVGLWELYKVKQLLYRPRQVLRFPGCWGSQFWRLPSYECDKVISPAHWPPFPPRKYSWYFFVLEADSTPGRYCCRNDYVNEKSRWHHREWNLRPFSL